MLFLNILFIKRHGAYSLCEPRFTDSREKCELGKNVNHRKMGDFGSQNSGSHNIGCAPTCSGKVILELVEFSG